MNKIIMAAALLLAGPVWADERGHESEIAEIELSPGAIRNYGIETAKFADGETQTLPRAAMVAAKDEYFIYAMDGGHFTEIEIVPLKITNDSVIFRGGGEEYVISGAKYLRVIFLNNKNPSEGHGH
jgi:hypothetical protein